MPYNAGMSTGNKGPQTLMEATKHYANLDTCHAFMMTIKWPDGVVKCPKCGGENIGNIASRRMFQCKAKDCRKQFSVKVGTIFEDSPLGLDKWMVAVWSITNAKNGISSCELARAIGVTQKSAWHMLHRIRFALKTQSFDKMTGEVESDETYVGGIAFNMHLSRRRKGERGTGGSGKAIVHGLLQRGGEGRTSKVKAKVIPNVKGKTLLPAVRESVQAGSFVYTDALNSYRALSADYIHQCIDHAKEYVSGRIHTNGLENFWSLFKRAIGGTYVSVDAQHLERYADEQTFRFNERKGTDATRFAGAMKGINGRRLMYKDLISANPPEGVPSSDGGVSGGAANWRL